MAIYKRATIKQKVELTRCLFVCPKCDNQAFSTAKSKKCPECKTEMVKQSCECGN